MKNTLLTSLIVFAISLSSYAQKSDSLKKSAPKNEVKFNLLYAINGMPEITYERIFRKNMGVGTALFIAIDNSADYKFGFTPYYRLYFGKREANGFFIEGNTGIVTLEDEYYVDVAHIYKITTTNLTLGIAGGAKYFARNGFFAEAYLGWGKLVAYRIGYNVQEVYRNGLTIGKRF